MAEAAVDKPTTSQQLKYFCHECSDSVEIKASATDATKLTCPKCDSSFIEELTQELESDHLHTENPYDRDPLSFLGRSNPSRFLSSMLLSLGATDHEEDEDEVDSDDDDDDGGLYHFMRDQSPFSPSQTRGSVSTSTRNGQQSPFHRSSSSSSSSAFSSHIRFLEQLLGNLRSGRNLDSSQPGESPHSFSQLFQGFHGDIRDYAWGADGIDNIITELLNQSEGTGPPPAREEDIGTLPSFAITQDYIDQAAHCSVCLENFALDETVKRLPCEHIFHGDCVIPWLQLHRTCPICRKHVGEASEGAGDTPGAGAVVRGADDPSGSASGMASSNSSSIFEDAYEEADQQRDEHPHSLMENGMEVDFYEDTGSSVDMEN